MFSPLFCAIRGYFALAFWLELRTLPVAIFVRALSSFLDFLSMPVAVLTAQEQNRSHQHSWTALSARSWKRKKVRRDVQATLAKSGSPQTARPSLSWKSTADKHASEWLHSADIGLSPSKDQTKSQQRKWWQRGRRQSEEPTLNDSSKRSSVLPASLQQSLAVMFVTMRRAWEANL